MRYSTAFLLLALLGLVGCGTAPPERPVPLAVAEWKALPVEQKYTAETLERLKEGDPNLATAEGWEAFSRTTLMQSRRADFARGKKKP